jgi:hypothetical protein
MIGFGVAMEIVSVRFAGWSERPVEVPAVLEDEVDGADRTLLLEAGQLLHDSDDPVRHRQGTRPAELLPRVIDAAGLRAYDDLLIVGYGSPSAMSRSTSPITATLIGTTTVLARGIPPRSTNPPVG